MLLVAIMEQRHARWDPIRDVSVAGAVLSKAATAAGDARQADVTDLTGTVRAATDRIPQTAGRPKQCSSDYRGASYSCVAHGIVYISCIQEVLRRCVQNNSSQWTMNGF